MEEEFESKLLVEIQKYPFLYDLTHPQYRDTQCRSVAWTKISYDLRVSVARLKGRWRSLRNSYRVELLRKVGDKPGKWKYYDMMNFLTVSLNKAHRKSERDLKEGDSTNAIKFEGNSPMEEGNESSVADIEIVDLVASDSESVSSTIRIEPNSTVSLSTNSPNKVQLNYESELRTFMEAMTVKISNENLNRDQMDELQEQMLTLLNRKLRDFRKINKE